MRWNLTHMFKFRSLFTPFLLLLVLFTLALSYADDYAAPAQQEEDAAPKVNPAVELPKMQKILDKIKG
ncbi:mechanosensitive ion channel protein MscS [Plautia stali symbiont]|nr:mechanosensitive ion channel protein MscS [Plautia stali symbiont]